MVKIGVGTTQQRILTAAQAAFAAAGFHGARIDAIAAAAGINKRMLYHYFGDKADLYRAVLESFPVPSLPAGIPDSEARLLSWIQALQEVYSPDQVRILAWAGLYEAPLPEPGSGRAPWASLASLAHQLCLTLAGLQGTTVQPDDPMQQHLAMMLLGSILLPRICPSASAELTQSIPGQPAFDQPQQQALMTMIKALVQLQRPKARIKLQPDLRPRESS